MVLEVPKGSVKRDAWTSQFSTVISALNLGKQSSSLPPDTTKVRVEYGGRESSNNPYADMVLIPAGNFQMGSNNSNPADEKPVHTVYVDAFYMDIHEVTNAQYKQFVDANPQWGQARIPTDYHDGEYPKHWNGNNYPTGKGDHPVYVSWYGAMAYAQWARKRLPTEAEWEKAARGGLVGSKYPWGNSIDPSQANYGNHVGNTTTVGSYPSNKYGLYDMTGNEWEWCLDAYEGDFYKNSPRRNPIAGEGIIRHITNNFTNVKTTRVLRGGSWITFPLDLRVAARFRLNPTIALIGGFRCVRGCSSLNVHPFTSSVPVSQSLH